MQVGDIYNGGPTLLDSQIRQIQIQDWGRDRNIGKGEEDFFNEGHFK
jgi:hypothetical protein